MLSGDGRGVLELENREYREEGFWRRLKEILDRS